tara:strand:+ start:150 stop:1007 length:858 start_codon:yes stop_codon:yes gene_type:complete
MTVNRRGRYMDEITFIFCFCDDFLKEVGFKDNHQAQMSTSEVLAFLIFAGKYGTGNHRKAAYLAKKMRLFKKILSPSRLCRRVHSIPLELLGLLFLCLKKLFVQANVNSEYIIDSFPIAVCKNARISRTKLFKGKGYHAYSSSKHSYFYGLRVHMLVTEKGEPVEFLILPGAISDIKALWEFPLALNKGATIYGDGAYNDIMLEELLNEDSITLLAKRKKSMLRQHPEGLSKRLSKKRKRVETSFSEIKKMFPDSITARTQKGFILRVISFILAFSLNCLVKATR